VWTSLDVHTDTKLSKIKMGKFERDIADANWT